MVQASYHFPRGFLWGTATASHQEEGNNTNNNWWKWEQDGHTNGKSGLACDWWGGRWKEDFDRAAEGGQNAHRFSVEWSRIQPTPDTWDEDALERYRAMLRGLRERGMTPMVTLHHFTDPLWLYEKCGWEQDEVVALFEKYVRKTVDALKEYCSYWCTINEPNVYALSGYVAGDFPACNKGLNVAMKVLALTWCADMLPRTAPFMKFKKKREWVLPIITAQWWRAIAGRRWTGSCATFDMRA